MQHINKIMQSDYWSSTAILFPMDDFGGWYDHVAPPRQQGGDAAHPYGLGFRLPLMVILALRQTGVRLLGERRAGLDPALHRARLRRVTAVGHRSAGAGGTGQRSTPCAVGYNRPVQSILDVETLRQVAAAGVAVHYRFFWGHRPRRDGAIADSCFSQWWPARFTVEREVYASAEHYMMAEKARLFGDDEVRRQVLAATDAGRAKDLGRQIRGFEEATWKRARFDIVTAGNVAKFGQDERLRRYLLATRDEILVETSPTDRVWGIGLGRDDPRAADPRAWHGLNLLGFALVRTRGVLRGDLSFSPPPRR